MPNPKPLLIISDAVAGTSGLARIARDISTRVHANLSDVYRLATAGHNAPGSRKFPWVQYPLEGMGEWIIPTLPEIVNDHAGEEKCIVMFIWDVSRLGWFSQPERIGSEALAKFPGLKEWLLKANFDIEKWLYTPIDASGPNDKLTFPLALSLMGFDRLLAYGPFGESVIRKTIGDEESNKRHLTNLPHGICGDTFYEHDRKLSRKLFFQYTGAQTVLAMLGVDKTILPLSGDEVLIGIVGTNQSRKDYALGIETASILAKNHRVRLWIHCDGLERYWSIPSLLIDYGMLQNTVISLGIIPDERMATSYSACDLTLGIGPEGFGYPLLESQYCGCPVVHGSYAGGADIVPKEWQVDPLAFRYEGSYSCKRPVYDAAAWAAKAEELIGKRCNLPGQYEWTENWKGWEKWFREAAK